MSTRANVIVTDIFGDKLYFYRHSDGYPEGTMPTLELFLDKVKSGDIRDNASQSAGHLILIGHEEYGSKKTGWKVGSYEPTTQIHGDVEYVYTVDVSKKTIEIEEL